MKQQITERSTFVFPGLLWKTTLLLAGYRLGMPVREIKIFRSPRCGETGYYVCPRCSMTLEREFVAFCDRCGQRLDWKDWKKARKIFPGVHER